MSLQQTIRRILKEESEIKQKEFFDQSSLIKRLLDKTFVQSNNNVVCKVEVKHPKDREVLQGQKKYISYSITVTVIGGYDTKYWPRTMKVNDMYDELLNEVWRLVYDFTNVACDVYLKLTKNCDDLD